MLLRVSLLRDLQALEISMERLFERNTTLYNLNTTSDIWLKIQIINLVQPQLRPSNLYQQNADFV